MIDQPWAVFLNSAVEICKHTVEIKIDHSLFSSNQKRSRLVELSDAAIKVKHAAKYFTGLSKMLGVSSRTCAVNLRLIVTLTPSWVPTITAAGAVKIVFDAVEVDANTFSKLIGFGGILCFDDHVMVKILIIVIPTARVVLVEVVEHSVAPLRYVMWLLYRICSVLSSLSFHFYDVNVAPGITHNQVTHHAT